MFGNLKAAGLTEKQKDSIRNYYNYGSETYAVFGFKRVYNYNSYLLLQWSKNVKNRIKAYKLIQQAIKLEMRYRSYYWRPINYKKTSARNFPTVIKDKPEYYFKLQ